MNQKPIIKSRFELRSINLICEGKNFTGYSFINIFPEIVLASTLFNA